MPIPPLTLIYKVTSSANIEWFLLTGELTVQSIELTLEKINRKINDFSMVLDFGCGCGRVIRHLKSFENVKKYGSDCNEDLISWCTTNLTYCNFDINASKPPLEYETDSFDFIYAISVFTHMPENLQLLWIKELSRVLKPDGLILITTHGKRYQNRLTKEEQKIFKGRKIVVKRKNFSGSNLCSAFHPEGYVRDYLLKDFTILCFVPEGMKGAPYQDIYLARNNKK